MGKEMELVRVKAVKGPRGALRPPAHCSRFLAYDAKRTPREHGQSVRQ